MPRYAWTPGQAVRLRYADGRVRQAVVARVSSTGRAVVEGEGGSVTPSGRGPVGLLGYSRRRIPAYTVKPYPVGVAAVRTAIRAAIRALPSGEAERILDGSRRFREKQAASGLVENPLRAFETVEVGGWSQGLDIYTAPLLGKRMLADREAVSESTQRTVRAMRDEAKGARRRGDWKHAEQLEADAEWLLEHPTTQGRP